MCHVRDVTCRKFPANDVGAPQAAPESCGFEMFATEWLHNMDFVGHS